MIRELIRGISDAAEAEESRQSLHRLGRVSFAFRLLTITGTAFAVEFLGDALLYLIQLPHVLYVIQRVIVFGLFGTILLRAADQRLLDAGLARRYRYPFIAAWLLSVSLSAAWPPAWALGLGLFVLLLSLGCSIPSKPSPPMSAPLDEPSGPSRNLHAQEKSYRPRWFVNPISFLRGLLTLACLWLPLIWMDRQSAGGVGSWLARCGDSILALAWFWLLLGRLNDADRLPRKRYGFLLIGLVLLLGAREFGVGWFHELLLSSFRFGGTRPRTFLNDVSGYWKLALFLLVQIPLAIWPSKPRLADPTAAGGPFQKRSRRRAAPRQTSDLVVCGPLEFLRVLSVIAAFWVPFIYMDRASAGGAGSWIARLAYCVLVFFWMSFAHGRFVDAGIAHSEYPSQYFLVVATASLMPLAFHWVNGYEALAIFALIQTPTVFFRSKPQTEDPLPEDTGPQEAQHTKPAMRSVP